MRHAVIRHGVRFLRDRYRHFVRNRIDFQLADRDLKGVVVLIRVLVYLKGELVLALANVRLASRKVIRRAFAVSKAVAANRYRFVHQRFAVVDLLIGSGGQLHAALLDFEIAIGNLKPDVREVVALVLEVRNFQPHSVSARVGAFRDHVYVSAVKLHILQRVIQLVAGLRIKAKDEMQLAVIHHTVRLALDLYRHSIRDRRDFQRAVLRRDSVVVRVRALFRLVGERVSTLANVRLASRKGIVQTFAVRERLFRARHFRYRGVAVLLRGAVVDLCQVGGSQRHRARVDLEPAVGNVKRHVREVRIRVLEVLSFPPHGVSARIRSSRSLSVLIPEVRHFVGGCFVQRVADVDNIILPSRMLLAVIRHGLRPALDRHNHFVRVLRDPQLAFVLGDCVVAFFEVRAFCIGDRVRHFTVGNVLHFAQCLDIRHFAFDKATFNLHVGLRQLRAVVGLAGRFGGQRHLARRDPQLAFVLHDIVVAFFEVSARIEEDRVRHFTIGNVRHCALRHDTQHFAVNKATFNLHFGLRQRCAVVNLASALARQRHVALLDYELAVRRLRNDILFRLVKRSNRIFRKVRRIGVSIRSIRANFDRAEISLFRRTGKAGNAMLVSIISQRPAVRRQLDVLIIVEIDLVLSRPKRNRLGFSRYRRVSLNPDGGFRHLFPEHLTANGLGFRDLLGRPVPVVVHRVAQVGSLRVIEGDRVRSRSDCNRFFRLLGRITVNRFRLFRYRCSERLILHALFRIKRLVRALLKVLHRVAQVGLLLKLRCERRILIQRISSCVCRFLIQLAVDVIQVIICLTIISFPTDKLISSIRRRNRGGQTPAARKVARHRLNLVCSAVRNRSAFAGSIGNVNGLFFVRLVVHIDRNRVVSDFFILNFPNLFIAFKGQRLSLGQLAILLVFCFFLQNYFRRRIFDDMLDRIRHVDIFEINNAVHMPREYRGRLIVICASGELVSCPSHIAKRNQFIVFPWF